MKGLINQGRGNIQKSLMIAGVLFGGFLVMFVAVSLFAPILNLPGAMMSRNANPLSNGSDLEIKKFDPVRNTNKELLTLENAIFLYEQDVGAHPKKLEELLEKPAGAKIWNGPYVKGNTRFTDIWGSPYIYDIEKRRIICAGPDKKAGTKDDIIVSFRIYPRWKM